MKNLITQLVSDATQNPTVQKAVAASTVGSGVATSLEWLSANIGVPVSLIGMALSIVLIYTTITQHRLKMQIMQRALDRKKSRDGRKDRRDDS